MSERTMTCPVCESAVTEVVWNEREGVKTIHCATGCETPEGWTAPDWWMGELRAAQRD